MPAVGSFKESPEFQFCFVPYGSIFAEFCILEKSILFRNTVNMDRDEINGKGKRVKKCK